MVGLEEEKEKEKKTAEEDDSVAKAMEATRKIYEEFAGEMAVEMSEKMKTFIERYGTEVTAQYIVRSELERRMPKDIPHALVDELEEEVIAPLMIYAHAQGRKSGRLEANNERILSDIFSKSIKIVKEEEEEEGEKNNNDEK